MPYGLTLTRIQWPRISSMFSPQFWMTARTEAYQSVPLMPGTLIRHANEDITRRLFQDTRWFGYLCSAGVIKKLLSESRWQEDAERDRYREAVKVTDREKRERMEGSRRAREWVATELWKKEGKCEKPSCERERERERVGWGKTRKEKDTENRKRDRSWDSQRRRQIKRIKMRKRLRKRDG